MLKLQIKDTPQKSIWLVGPHVTVGRAKSNSLVLDVPGVDTVHAELMVDGEKVFISNKSGSQSVAVNGQQVDRKHLISLGDVITLNTVELELVDPKSRGKVNPDPHTRMPSARQAPRVVNKNFSGWKIQAHAHWMRDQVFDIGGLTVVGRSKDCDVSIPGDYLSRRHAELSVLNGVLNIKDLGSSNGCFINGERVTDATLCAGDIVTLDVLDFTVVYQEEEADRTVVRDGKRGDVVDPPTILQTEPSLVPSIMVPSIMVPSAQDQNQISNQAETLIAEPLIAELPMSIPPLPTDQETPEIGDAAQVEPLNKIMAHKKLLLNNPLIGYGLVVVSILVVGFAALLIFNSRP